MSSARRLPTLLYLLLAAALFMRALLPQGVMPEARADTVAVKLCAGGMMMLPLQREGAPADERQSDESCAFSGLGFAAVPPPAFADLQLPDPAPLAFGAFATGASAALPFEALPPVRGPPLPA